MTIDQLITENPVRAVRTRSPAGHLDGRCYAGPGPAVRDLTQGRSTPSDG